MYFIDVVVMLLQPTLYIFFAALSLAQFQVRKMKPTRRKQHTHGPSVPVQMRLRTGSRLVARARSLGPCPLTCPVSPPPGLLRPDFVQLRFALPLASVREVRSRGRSVLSDCARAPGAGSGISGRHEVQLYPRASGLRPDRRAGERGEVEDHHRQEHLHEQDQNKLKRVVIVVVVVVVFVAIILLLVS